MKVLRLFRPLDILFIALSALAAVLSLVAAASGGKTAVLVVTSPSGEYRWTLDKNISVPISGILGDSIIVIENGRARFLDSPCENKVCVLHSPLAAVGHWSACLPNQVMLRIEGTNQEIDIFTN